MSEAVFKETCSKNDGDCHRNRCATNSVSNMEEGLEKKKQGIPNSMMGEIQNPKFQLVLNN